MSLVRPFTEDTVTVWDKSAAKLELVRNHLRKVSVISAFLSPKTGYIPWAYSHTKYLPGLQK